MYGRRSSWLRAVQKLEVEVSEIGKIVENEEPKLHVSCDTPTLSRAINALKSRLPTALKKLVVDGIGVDEEEGGV